LQKVVRPPLGFLRSVGAMICQHRSRCAIDFLLILAPPGDGLPPIRTRYTHSRDHGDNQSAAQRHCRFLPTGLRATILMNMNPLINITSAKSQFLKQRIVPLNGYNTTYRG
jgi:hypothetical protein